MTAAELEAEFRSRTVPHSGGLLLLRPDDAIDMIRRAAAEAVPVLGIDGMFVRPNETISPIEHIIDFSSATRRGNGCWIQGEQFIVGRRDLGLVFEITLGNHLDRPV
jgi:hypothetical protein